ncbi:hypothetical protein PC9H_006017 [Pleurotus ostreatus]|uniref:Uncharacterized protein n=1 Tax=Pleurotus ostreatus TaxID=5322 RepID=A0A8H6ZVE9_PLEOS|nr:uncharacterized protein PC9H_006017 [Pleurotus ostreatus]KAF7430313.1 hypothetical protein PC9H_006017 [Pleurotus ostreatus]KAJ8701426.1 hypothetical protein PTI98_000212 [Pleurotus ostreatus]
MAHSHLCKLATANNIIMSRFDHTSYYQSNLAASHNAYPSGWQPPFQGPPPIPAGANINPQVWNTGQWMFNPAYQHRQPSQIPNQTAWMAGHQWSAHAAAHGQAVAQAQAQGQSHNPYKKPIRPPSAEYLSQKLVDNPLGLSDMTPREELYGTATDGAQPHTPWIWNPRGLVETKEEEGIITADYRDSNGRRIAQESRGLAPSRQGSINGRNGSDTARSASPAAMRHSTDPSVSGPTHRRHESATPARHQSEPPQIYASANGHSLTPQRRGSSQERAPSHADRIRDEPQRRNSDAGISSRNQPLYHESFTSHTELKPTFPSSIVRTPGHYSHPPSRSNSTPIYSNNPYASATGVAQAAQLAAQIERMTLGGSGRPGGAELSRHSSLPTSAYGSSTQTSHHASSSSSTSLSDVNALSDEPTAMLSPLMLGTTPKPSSRSLGRTSSIPGGSGSSSLSSIPETSSPLNPNIYSSTSGRNSASSSTTHSPIRQSPSSRQSSGSRRTSPAPTPPQRSPSDPQFSYQAYSQPSSSYHTPYSSTSHRSPSRHSYVSPSHSQNTSPDHQPQSAPQQQQTRPPNPLPAPPMEIRPPLSNPSPRKKTPPVGYTRRVRKGFWNRRGDHLTRSGCIVYAPAGRTSPDELRGYPDQYEGYRDEFGTFADYDGSRPELPESLPYHGKPPSRPYDSFIEYDYQYQ